MRLNSYHEHFVVLLPVGSNLGTAVFHEWSSEVCSHGPWFSGEAEYALTG